jgi:pimeloyl-ACP methyl ester carboxylesterase
VPSDHGDAAPPVLLVHGLATSCARTWGDNGWLDLLADAGRDVIGVDLLGHGDAPKPHDPAAYEQLEQAVADRLPDEPADAIGFSLGARVILTLAAERPSRFRRIVVAGVGANLFERDAERGQLIAKAVGGDAPPDDPVSGYFAGLADTPGTDREALVALLRCPRPELTRESLGAIDRPVLVVLGDRDFAGPADPLVDALPDARLVTLRNVDHFATPKQFGFIDAALEFLG